MTSRPDAELRPAGPSDLAELLPLVRGYHAFEKIEMSDSERSAALAPLLEAESQLGCAWLIHAGGKAVGYVAICFGYSIEFGGRDAFVDEMFIVPAARGQGIGSEALRRVREEATAMGIVALHLEVERSNERARRLYEKWGFEARDRFHMMSCRLA